MALNKIYTDNTVIMKRNGGTLAWVATKPYNELFGENEFELSILLNNSSTSKMLNNGAYGKNPTKYLDLRTIASGEPTVPIQFLGCFLSTTDSISISYGFNITKKTPFINENLGGDSWTNFINNFRFVIDFIPATNNISYETYQDFDYNNTTAVKYGFSTSYIEFNAEYKKENISTLSSTTKNPELISGDDAKRFVYSNAYVTTTNYNKYLDDNTQLTKEWLCLLWYAFRVNGDLIIIRYPEYMPTSGDYRTRVELSDGTYEFLTIGGFSDTVIDGTTGGLPENDDTKGLYVSYWGRGSNSYYSTNNAIMHNANSSGIKWTVNEITTAKNFRDYVRLGVMDANGLITHNEWLQGELGIANSENPNKNGSYSDLPEWKPSGSGGDDIDEIGINDFPFDNVGGLARYYAIDRFQLDELVSDFKKSEEGIPLDAGNFIIGLYQLPIDIPSFCTSSQEKIVLGKLETNAVGKKLLTVNRRIPLGEYFISANCGNNFLDYSPYTEIKLYIPFCGMVELPPNLFINSNVSVDMIVDIISGSCKGVVMCNNTFYTSVNGSLMCSLPLSLEQCATKSLSIINSANSIMSGIIFGNKNYSALNTITTLGEAMIENNNIAPSHISGNMDSVVNFYDPQCCILFMTYPEVNMGDISKTHGNVCNYQDTLNNCHGYTVVNNPHLEIKCTNTEKDEITKLLEQGVILP